MFIVTAKLNKKKVITGVLIFGVLLCAIIVASATFRQDPKEAPVSKNGAEVTQPITKGIKTNDDRVAMLKSFGWQVKKDPVEFMEVLIPDEFDDVYQKYNELQKSQGMDLKKYAGKRVMRYTYLVDNYPSGEKDIRANVLIYKNNLIGGDVNSPQLNGFMIGLKRVDK